MPRKPTKPREQKIAEEFFPIEPTDIKVSIEKKYSPLDPALEIAKKVEKPSVFIEKIAKSRKKSESVVKNKKPSKIIKNSPKGGRLGSSSVAKKAPKEFVIPKIALKKDGYELIITEKPQAAQKIAESLGTVEKRNLHGVYYYEVERQGKKIVVACAVGHLFTLAQDKKNTTGGPAFNISWQPNFLVRKKDFTKKYYDVLSSLAKKAGSITVATDYDIEGEVIGLNVVRLIAGQSDASRMKFSTLTKNELNEAYDSKSDHLDWGQAIAGETRHHLDWFYGINISRLLMAAIKTAGNFRIISIGRVQGPTLSLIVKKEREIKNFKPKTYWQVFVKTSKPELEFLHNKDIFNKPDLKKFENIVGKTAIASTKKTEEKLQPNPPFNLTILQTEAYRLYGITPAKTLAAAQSLYLGGMVSYPRTSSQKLPPSIAYQEILKNMSKIYKVEKLITKDKPIEGSKTDPAHPSIYPTGTGNVESLDGDEKRIYDLIVKRFLCLFMDEAVIENKKVSLDVKSDKGFLTFLRRGSEIKKKSWLSVYPSRIKEKELPDLSGEVKIVDSRTEEKETQPPNRYSPASILTELEKKNLGTKATRSAILETLYQRGYIQDQSIKATPIGISLIETLEKHSPIITEESLTREFENDMESIRQVKKNPEEKEKKIIEKAKETITKISEQFKNQEKEIGEELSDATSKLWVSEREEGKLNLCPLCKKGNLGMRYSNKTKRYFIGCDSYPECKNIYSLPPNGLVKKTDKICESCGFPMLMLLKRGRKPWIFCFNKDCEINKKRLEAYRAKKAEEEKSDFKTSS